MHINPLPSEKKKKVLSVRAVVAILDEHETKNKRYTVIHSDLTLRELVGQSAPNGLEGLSMYSCKFDR